LNFLSGALKKTLYHQAEGSSTFKSFRVMLPYEAFFYLSFKLRNIEGVIIHKIERKQRFVFIL